MIPKKIHYCWFGRGEKPKLAKKCIESWKKHCPDYEIIEWNEDNFDVDLNDYTKFSYENKLYAYLSDYVRLWVVEKYGGVYFDTDVEIIKSFDELLPYNAYFGFESNDFINTGIGFGAIPHHPAVVAMLRAYDIRKKSEFEADYLSSHSMYGSPRMNTGALIPFGLQKNGIRQIVCDAEIFPIEYFCPFDDITGKLSVTRNTFSIHWYTKSAHGKMAVIRCKFTRPIHRILKFLGK